MDKPIPEALKNVQRWDIGYTEWGAAIQHKPNGAFVKLEDAVAVLTAAQQQGQGHPDSEFVGATAKVRDCLCQKYEGRACRKCFRPPYPDQQGQAVCECPHLDMSEPPQHHDRHCPGRTPSPRRSRE